MQRRWIASTRPWMGCLGGNFSIPADAGVLFDENFESRGSEDRDFAHRAFRSGMRPKLLPSANAIHLTVPSTQWSAMTHHDIGEFLHKTDAELVCLPRRQLCAGHAVELRGTLCTKNVTEHNPATQVELERFLRSHQCRQGLTFSSRPRPSASRRVLAGAQGVCERPDTADGRESAATSPVGGAVSPQRGGYPTAIHVSYGAPSDLIAWYDSRRAATLWETAW